MPRPDLGAVLLAPVAPPSADGGDNTSRSIPQLITSTPPPEQTCRKLSESGLVTGFLPLFSLATCSALAFAVWPLGFSLGLWSNACGSDMDDTGDFFKNELDGVIGASPGWLRSALLLSVGSQLLAGLCGFGECGPLRQVGRAISGCFGCSETAVAEPAQGEDDGEAEAYELQALLLKMKADLAASPSYGDLEQLDELVAARHFRCNERHLQREANLQRQLAVALLRKRGLLRLLLTGHGLHPAPRLGAGWLAIADVSTPQATWDDARLGLGLSVRQAIGVSATKLVCWHWVQPFAYFWVFRSYYCDLSDTGAISQRDVGQIVAAREVLYLGTTVAALLACPVYLLTDITTIWMEADTTTQKVTRVAAYLLTPHNFVALSLAGRFRPEKEEGRLSANGILQLLFYLVAFAQIIADFASCFALGSLLKQCSDGDFCEPALLVGFTCTAFGFLLFFAPLSIATSFSKARENWQHMTLKRGIAAGGGLLMLLGLIWVALGALLLLGGTDIYCSWYTFSGTKCGDHGACAAGHCDCDPGFGGEFCDVAGQTGPCTNKQMREAALGLRPNLAQCGQFCCAGSGNCTTVTNEKAVAGGCWCSLGFAGERCDVCGGEYSGERCQRDPCFERACGHGSCRVSGITHTCECESGWDGFSCERATGCDGTPCGSHGSCSPQGGKHTCECASGWSGEQDCAHATGCDASPDCGHGNCTAQGGEHTCSCETGWYGPTCELQGDAQCGKPYAHSPSYITSARNTRGTARNNEVCVCCC